MATLVSGMMSAFEEGYKFSDKISAYEDARKKYGSAASDPGLFSALGQEERAQNQDVRAERQDGRAERQTQIQEQSSQRQQQAHDTGMESEESERRKKATLNMIGGFREARDNGEDMGEVFDRYLETGVFDMLGVSEEDIPGMREAVVEDPTILDDYYVALGGEVKAPAKTSGSDRQRALDIMQNPDASDAEKTWAGKIMDIDPDAAPGDEDEGAKNVSNIIAELKGFYDGLKEGDGITNADLGVLGNANAWLRTTWAGRTAGRMTRTDNESFRRSIEGMRPHLINAMKSAEEMGARMFDSNKDMELWLGTVTDPTQDYETVMRLLNEFDRMYGKAVSEAEASTPELAPGWKDPDTGAVFKGGNPGDPGSWEMP